MRKFTILIHGGAGTITGNSSDKCHYLDALRRIISEIYKYTSCGKSISYDKNLTPTIIFCF
jgi:hypothetical protein